MRQPRQRRTDAKARTFAASPRGALGQSQKPKLVAAYRLNAGQHEQYVVDVDGRLAGPWASAPLVGGELKVDQLDRIVFFKDGKEFLVVDLVPEKGSSSDLGKGSWIRWIPGSDNGRIEVQGKVRCFLLNSSVTEVGCLVLAARVRKVKGAEEFKFKVTTPGNQGQIDSVSYTANLEQAITKANTVINTSKENGFTRELGLNINTLNPKVEVLFTNLQFGFYVINFKSEIYTESDGLRTFDADSAFEFSKHRLLTLIQQPSKNIAAENKIFPRLGQAVGRWAVQLQKLPASSALRYWNKFAEQYYDSLLTVQGGLPVSFLPIFAEPDDDDGAGEKSWTLAYHVFDASAREMEKSIRYVYPEPSETPAPAAEAITIFAQRLQQAETQTLAASFGQLKKHDERPLTAQLEPAAAPAESFEAGDRGFVISLKKPVGASLTNETTTTVRMGALDLEFGDFGKDSFGEPPVTSFRLLPYRDLLEVHTDAVFAVASIRAGGQDNIPGEEFVPEGSSTSDIEQCALYLDDQALLAELETIVSKPPELKAKLEDVRENELEAHFRRKRPLVIDPQLNLQHSTPPSEEQKKPNYLLLADEDAQKGSSHTIRLRLQSVAPSGSTPQPARPDQEAIVLDNEPFLVAKVRFNPFTAPKNSVEIGNWTNAGIEGTNWQLRSETKPFDLFLPPQGLGEEMEKAKNVVEGQPVDFRFAPPARIRLKGSENPQNFTEPPWNLRRILGFPGQRAPGAVIEHLQFELLYGLSCDSSYQFLRLAEVFSLVGAIQGRLPRSARSGDVERLDDEDPRKLYYRLARLEWAALYRRYLSRIAILEPWDSHQPEHLLLSKDTVCRIRNKPEGGLPAAELQPPVEASPSSPLLKGGVTWGFESKNVYNAVMRVKPGQVNPTTDDAEVNDLYFSAFGGWGSVKAPFDDKKSTIYADVSMGRTYRYKIERIGRISCWWNLAKHVIVYERTVVPSRQMNDTQNKLKGRPLLRKVEEYVEVLEDTRHYPDGENPDSDILKQQRGFVTACSFPKGAKYNVLSSWGADVSDIGWKVPLWNPSATPADIYPKPKVHLHLASAIASRSVPAPALIGNPENLYFYTETRAGSTRSPNGWAPVRNVDYVDLPKPQPLADFQDGKNQQTTPNDSPVHPGFSLCTFTLEPNGIPADMVAARVGKPLAAVVETVTMMRARLNDATTANNELPEKIINLRRSAAEAFQGLLRLIPTDEEAAWKSQLISIRDEIARRFDERFRQIRGDIDAFKADFENRRAQLRAKLESYENGAFDRFRRRLTEDRPGAKSIITAAKERYDELRDALEKPDVNLAAVKSGLSENLRALQEAVLLLNASPGILPKAFRQYVEAFLGWAEDSETVSLEFTKQVDLSTPGDLTGEQLRSFKATVRALLQLEQSFEARVRNGSFRPAEAWLPDPYERLHKDYFSVLRGLWETMKRDGLDAVLAAPASFPKSAAKQITDFFEGGWKAHENFTKLRLFVVAFPDAAQFFDYLSEAEVSDESDQLLKGWIGEQLNEVEKARTADELRAAIDNVLRRRVGDDSTDGSLLWHLKEIRKYVVTNEDVQRLLEMAQGSVDELVRKLTDQLETELKAHIAAIESDLRGRLEKLRDDFLKEAGDFVEKNVRSLLPEDALKFASPDSVARLVRAFGRPPEVPNLGFDRPHLAYFYKELDQAVGLTPVLSRVRQASAIADELKSIGIALPTERLFDKLIPPDLKNFSLSEILPNIAGLDLSNLFSGLKMPEMGNDNVKIMHGFDPQSRRAWVESKVSVEVREPATVFSIGPVTLRLTSALFAADVRFEAAPNQPPKRVVNGRIRGTWELVISEIVLVKFRDTELRFDDSGKFRFDISPRNVELPDILSFVSEFLKSFSSPDSGFSVGLTPKGVQALLNLPIPDIQAGAFGISNLVLGMAFGLDFTSGFKIYLSFSLGRKEAPFALVIFILGGGGYIEQVTAYTPATGAIDCTVEVGITACASLAIALGPIKGGVYVYFGVFANLALSKNPAENKGLTIGVMFLIRGEVNVLGIAYACISLLLEARYRNGELIGRGKLSIKIKICWCFTLKVEKEVEYKLGGGGRSAQNRAPERLDAAGSPAPRFLKAGFTRGARAAAPPAQAGVDYAADYIEMLS